MEDAEKIDMEKIREFFRKNCSINKNDEMTTEELAKETIEHSKNGVTLQDWFEQNEKCKRLFKFSDDDKKEEEV